MPDLSILSWVFLLATAVAWFANAVELVAAGMLKRLRHRDVPERWPSFTVLKPLAGHDDELELNLESHLAIDYPGEWEVLLGVRGEQDGAYALARAFADRHPGRVRLFVQEGEPGLNPKVNQLITLTRHAKGELLALTDSNVRVAPNYLREHAAYLARKKTGLTSNVFAGLGEASLGSALDNLTLCSFCLPNISIADVVFRFQQIVAKSVAIKREALEAVGGWEAFKDLLAEDQRLGQSLKHAGYRTAVVNTPVMNVQKTQGLAQYFARHSRWAMIRFLVLPGVYLEPLLNPTVMALFFALSAWWLGWAWALLGASMVFSTVTTDLAARVGRGSGFALKWLALVPLRDVVFFGCWLRGAFLREVSWRGNAFRVGAETRLSRLGGA